MLSRRLRAREALDRAGRARCSLSPRSSRAGCGDSGDDGGEAAPPPAQARGLPRPVGQDARRAARGPRARARARRRRCSLLEPGKNRLGFGLFDRARKQIVDAPAALYVAPLEGGPVRGPFPARYESLEVKPQFQSEGVKADPDAATSVYVADVRFPKAGRLRGARASSSSTTTSSAAERVAVRVVKDGAGAGAGRAGDRGRTRPTDGGRRRRRRADRHARAAEHDARRGPRRRARQEAGRC